MQIRRNKHGDALFRRAVDGTELCSVTMWFYGTLPGPMDDWERSRIKQFNVSDLLLLDEVHAFIQSTGSLSFLDLRRLRAEAKRWNANLASARQLIVRCSPYCQGFLWLFYDQKMPYCVVVQIVAFWEEA